MTKLIALWGVLMLAAFVWLWPPGGFLLLGLVLLGFAALRALNEASTKGARR